MIFYSLMLPLRVLWLGLTAAITWSNSVRGLGHQYIVRREFLNRCYSAGFHSDGEGGRGKRAEDARFFLYSPAALRSVGMT